jgi:hypothetical protein
VPVKQGEQIANDRRLGQAIKSKRCGADPRPAHCALEGCVESLRPDIAAPLLEELGRALRAWRFYRSDPRSLRAVLECVGQRWTRALASGSALVVELRNGRMTLGGGAEIAGPDASLEELGELLAARGVEYLRADPGLGAGEIAELVGVLAENGSRGGDLERALRERGASHLWLTPPLESSRRKHSSARELSALTVELVRALEALEVSEVHGDYACAVDGVESIVERLLGAGNVADAYRAVLALCRHASDPDRSRAAIAGEARERLRRLLHREPLLEYALRQACESSGLASVQATQVLLAVDDLSAPRVVARYAAGGSGETPETAMILLALGERALAPLIEHLARGDSACARRAARMLGNLQHPRGIPALAAALRSRDPGVCDESARALARIGTTAAVHALVESLGSGDEVPARAIVASLSGSRHPLAVRALCDLASDDRTPEPLALDAIRALGHAGNGGAVPTLCAILGRRALLARRQSRRAAAARALGRIGGPVAERALETHARRGDVGDACRRALRDLARSSTGTR